MNMNKPESKSELDSPIPYSVVDIGADEPIPYTLEEPVEFCKTFVIDEPAVTAAE